ncbi:MAG: DUF202 domain-containing protein [Bacteroidetes bacterium]|nr:DUF202 domain-containing protein [Bacteroidota bacterium]
MEYEISPAKRQNASDHLANERTLLAWLRTGIGIMAFGFVVVKFSLFVRQLSVALGRPAAVVHYGYSGPIGIVLVAFGALSLLLSLLRYEKTKRQLLSGDYRHSSGFLYVLVGVVIAMSGVLIVYLVKTM